ncbi:MAG: hypothetical protein GF355_17500 [Candidatus Eisenbacteria bacterium]|nr:hypothetical protein [Candidatus Eisenbacteria bacterium]
MKEVAIISRRSRRHLWGAICLLLFAAAAGTAAEEPRLILPEADPPRDVMELMYRVNCGGDSLVDNLGKVYRPDRAWSEGYGYGYLEGAATGTWHTVGGTPVEEVYRTQRHNFFRYRFEVPDGQYLVTLKMADYKSHMAGQNAYELWVMADQMFERLDIFQRVERDYALKYRFLTDVWDGLLVITGISWPLAQMAAIEVHSAAPDGDPPGTPVIKDVIDSFGCVICDWEDRPELDLAGYKVYRKPLAGGQWAQINDELSLVSRYLDFSGDPEAAYQYRFSAVDVFGNESPVTDEIAASPLMHEETEVTLFHVAVDSADYALINAYPDSEIYIPAVVTVNDTVYGEAEIRYRGNVIRKLLKKSYKVRFSQNNPFRGLARKVNLTAEYPDFTLLREDRSYAAFRATGIPCPDTEPVHLVLNGSYFGTYLMVEHVDERFLENHNLEENTLVYKCYDRLTLKPDTSDYKELYTKETMEDGESWADIIRLIEMLNTTSQEAVYDSLIRTFDVENFIKYYGHQIAQGNFDFIWKNYFLAHDLERDIWQIWPWDLDLSFGIPALWESTLVSTTNLLRGANPNGNILADRMMDVPALKNLHLCNLMQYTTTVYDDSAMTGSFQTAHDRIRFDAERDWRKRGWEDNRNFYEGPEELAQFVAERNAYITQAVSNYFEPQSVFINELMAANLTTLADEYGEYDDWIELYNMDADTLFLAGYYLTAELKEPYAWAFPDTFIPPDDFLVVWADDDEWQGPLHANFKLSRNGETVALHRMGAAVEAAEVIFFGPQGDDISWGRRADGECPFDYMDEPTPGQTNYDVSGAGPDPLPASAKLSAWPNPSSGPGVIALTLPQSSRGAVGIYDVHGRCVRHLHQGPLPAGISRWMWDGRDAQGRHVAGGVYWVRAWTPGEMLVQKLVRLR